MRSRRDRFTWSLFTLTMAYCVVGLLVLVAITPLFCLYLFLDLTGAYLRRVAIWSARVLRDEWSGR